MCLVLLIDDGSISVGSHPPTETFVKDMIASGLLGLLMVSSISCYVFMHACFVWWYWNKVWSKFLRSVLICYPISNVWRDLGFSHRAQLFKTTVSSHRHTNERPHSKSVHTNCTSFFATSPGFTKTIRINSLTMKPSSCSFLCKRFVETKQTKQHALGVLLSCRHIHQSRNFMFAHRT